MVRTIRTIDGAANGSSRDSGNGGKGVNESSHLLVTHLGLHGTCWRALANSGVDLHVMAFRTDAPGAGTQAAFRDDVVQGLNIRLLAPSEQTDSELILSHALSIQPDIIVIPGWFHRPYTNLARSPKLSAAKFMMTMDTPWKNQWRQKAARFKIGGLLSRLSVVVVAGERAWQYARQLQIPEQNILRGVYGFDAVPLESIAAERASQAWPKKFLFVGRYVEDKAIDILLAGYQRYRARFSAPWPMSCCGQGKFKEQIAAAEGVADLGFVQPRDLPRILLEHGTYILASRYEPWGVALAEAQYSGLPVICTEACGASVELTRHLASGLIIPTEDADALADAMLWIEQHPDRLAAMGAMGKQLAAPFAAEFWAQKWAGKMLSLQGRNRLASGSH